MDHSHHIHILMNVHPLEAAGFIAILSYSFFASLHCGLMCAPLVCSVLGPKCAAGQPELWIYNTTRIIGYTLLGSTLGAVSSNLGSWLAWFAGIFLIIFALVPRDFGLLVKAPKGFSSIVSKSPPKIRAVLLGGITMLLPCMTLTPAYGMAIGSGSEVAAAAYMLSFGLGTLPVMLLTPAASTNLINRSPQRWSKMVARIFLILAGCITIWRSFQ